MKNKAATLMEVLVVVSIITALFVGLIVMINPMETINRGYDVTRRKDLDDAKKMLEQYIDDTGCYPQPTQVCIEGDNASPCHICTKVQTAQFSHFTKDICDPKHGNRADYLYQPEEVFVPGVGYPVVACPKWFRIFSVLDSAYNSTDDLNNCKKGGCGVNRVGVSQVYGYSYLVTSPGAPVESVATTKWYCYYERLNRCISCKFAECSLPSNDCYQQELYPLPSSCCSAHSLVPCI